MLCTRPIVYLALSLAREYNFDLGVDHWIARISLVRTKEMFLDSGGDKRVRRK